jgi:DNA polymerase III subunit gamma/tau
MGQALYRKHRPKTFAAAVGQEHITKTLQQAIKSGRVSHAYLFTGPRGVGKTSVARILAHEVNGLSYDDSVHLDIIEIDAASNRRIDEIRDLREKVNIAPAAAKYKVYIIDEVHMLTREAFNALLKTLEEPPAHVIFVLATTEAHKLPETIISRTQRFEFKPVSEQKLVEHLSDIAKKEKIEITKGALEILAQFGEGSFRDSISYLDQLGNYGRKIDEADIRMLLGLPPAAEVKQILNHVRAGDVKAAADALRSIYEQAVDAADLATAISKELRSLVVAREADSPDVELLKNLLEVKASPSPRDQLEVILLTSAMSRRPKDAAQAINSRAPKPERKPKTDATAQQPSGVESDNDPPHSKAAFSLDQWDDIVELSKKQAASIYTALRLASPSLDNDKLTLAFEFPLHQKKLQQAKNRALVSEIIEKASGQAVTVEAIVDKKATVPLANNDDNHLQSISSIFGSAEMIET